MKFNVIIIKRRTLIVLTILLLFICSGFLYLTKINFNNTNEITVPTMAKPQGEQTVKKDFNGDGKEDVLYITSKKGKYYLEVNINDTTYFFNEKKPLNTLGNYYEFWPMTINIIDINRDKLPEIIIQSSQDNTPIQHVFTWTGNEFTDIYCSSNNIIGLLDSGNNQTPKFLSLTIDKKVSEIQQYLVSGKILKNISYENYKAPGLDSIRRFIDAVTFIHELSEPPNIFLPQIPSDNVLILWQLDKGDYFYTFEDGFFRDDAWDKDGAISSCTWTINFKKTSKSSKDDNTQVSFKISLDKVGETFLIRSIDFFKKNN